MRQMPGHLCNKTTGKIINNNSMPKTKNSDQKPAKAGEMKQTNKKNDCKKIRTQVKYQNDIIIKLR